MVRHFDDVAPGVADDSCDPRQSAWLIGTLETQRDEATFSQALWRGSQES